MICQTIKGPSLKEAMEQIGLANRYADLIELRLDLLENRGLEEIKALKALSQLPFIFTLRSPSQKESILRGEELLSLCSLQPNYIDLEHPVSHTLMQTIRSKFPSIQIILSSHHFQEVPIDLENLLREMEKSQADLYKIAILANSSLDAMRLLLWKKNQHQRVITISMGSAGQISRLLAPLFSIPFTYASSTEESATAPGQLTSQALRELYRTSSLTSQTALYGLIGDPVENSISDQTHNKFFQENQINAIYIKMKVASHELEEALKLAKEIGFRGLSVTMPLKEAIIPYLDEIDPEAAQIGAVNTLLFEGNKIQGFNTDGKGALNAIEQKSSVQGKKMLLIGTGGAAKAIAYEAIKRGAFVTLLNRDGEKARRIAELLGCQGRGFNELQTCIEEDYDILINCTPSPSPTPFELILPNKVVMEIKTKPKENPFLEEAKKKNCMIIYGYEMFWEQAQGQYAIWFKEEFSKY